MLSAAANFLEVFLKLKVFLACVSVHLPLALGNHRSHYSERQLNEEKFNFKI